MNNGLSETSKSFRDYCIIAVFYFYIEKKSEKVTKYIFSLVSLNNRDLYCGCSPQRYSSSLKVARIPCAT